MAPQPSQKNAALSPSIELKPDCAVADIGGPYSLKVVQAIDPGGSRRNHRGRDAPDIAKASVVGSVGATLNTIRLLPRHLRQPFRSQRQSLYESTCSVCVRARRNSDKPIGNGERRLSAALLIADWYQSLCRQ